MRALSPTSSIGRPWRDIATASPCRRAIGWCSPPGTRHRPTNIPADSEAQADLCFANIAAILAEDGMTMANVIRLSENVTAREQMQGYRRSRDRQFPGTPPTTTLLMVSGLARPEFWSRSKTSRPRPSAHEKQVRSGLQPVAGLEHPPDHRHAQREEHQRHRDADGDIDIGHLEKAPAEAADQIDDRIEQCDRPPERRQHAGRIEGAAEKGQRRNDQKRDDLQLLETVGPDADE